MFLIPFIIRASGGKLAERGAKILLAVLAAVVVIGIVWGVIALRDQRMITSHDARQDLAISQAARDADMTADTASAQREAQHANEVAQTQETIEHATQAHPVDAARPSGPAVTAVTDELRRRRGTASVR